MQVTRHTAVIVALAAMLLSAAAVSAENARLAPRERILLDDGWRFHAGDPGGDSAPYLYDVRPAVTVSADGKDLKVIVDFPNAGRKTILAKFLRQADDQLN